MKTNGWKILGAVLLASTLMARADGQPEPEKPQANPAKKADAKKVAAPKKAPAEKPIVLVPGPATVSGNNVNVRGRAGYKGEVFTKLNNGDTVTVIEQVILQKPKAGEPSQWAKIAFPTNAHVWVHSAYIDASKTVKPKTSDRILRFWDWCADVLRRWQRRCARIASAVPPWDELLAS